MAVYSWHPQQPDPRGQAGMQGAVSDLFGSMRRYNQGQREMKIREAVVKVIGDSKRAEEDPDVTLRKAHEAAVQAYGGYGKGRRPAMDVLFGTPDESPALQYLENEALASVRGMNAYQKAYLDVQKARANQVDPDRLASAINTLGQQRAMIAARYRKPDEAGNESIDWDSARKDPDWGTVDQSWQLANNLYRQYLRSNMGADLGGAFPAAEAYQGAESAAIGRMNRPRTALENLQLEANQEPGPAPVAAFTSPAPKPEADKGKSGGGLPGMTMGPLSGLMGGSKKETPRRPPQFTPVSKGGVTAWSPSAPEGPQGQEKRTPFTPAAVGQRDVTLSPADVENYVKAARQAGADDADIGKLTEIFKSGDWSAIAQAIMRIFGSGVGTGAAAQGK